MRCLLVDDCDLFLAAARDLLEREQITVVGVASCGAEAVRRSAEARPDVVLVDVNLGAESGLEVAGRLAGPSGDRPLVILTSTYSEDDFHDAIVGSRAVAFLPKSEVSGGAIRRAVAAARPGAGARP
ncbi:response regulator [Sphaerisporangium rufum]|uniref:Response regulator n=1 Tax=Sphaerisporangium rufum TaxID=1381558 RepID=A0A919V4P9_9ACTN|nr:response regulator [Sphaerisporangium rufum]